MHNEYHIKMERRMKKIDYDLNDDGNIHWDMFRNFLEVVGRIGLGIFVIILIVA